MSRLRTSVVLANYNGADFLKEAIEGAVNQSRLPEEIVLVDDGSTDNSAEIIGDFASRHPKLVRPVFLDENRGQAAGFNVAMEHVTGDLVAFLDSDDFWFPNKIENVAQAFEAGLDCAFYEHNLNMLREGEILDDLFRPSLRLGDIFGYCQQSRRIPLFVPTSGLVFRRSILEKIMPIPDAFRTCADGFFTRTAMCHGPVRGTLDSYGAYRVHPSNQTFESSSFSGEDYTANLLIPELNRFYEEHDIELRFPEPSQPLVERKVSPSKKSLFDQVLDTSPRRILRKIRGAIKG